MKLRAALIEKEKDIEILKAEHNKLLKQISDTIDAKDIEIDFLKAEVYSENRKTKKAEMSLETLKMRSNKVKKKMSGKNIQMKKSQQNPEEQIDPVKRQVKLLVPAPTPPPTESLSQSLDKKSLNF